MTAAGPRKVVDILPQLSDDIYAWGMRDVIIESLKNGQPGMKLLNDFFRLSPDLKGKAYKAGVERSRREILKFVKLLVEELEEALEIDRREDGQRQDGDDNDTWNSKKPRASSPTPPRNAAPDSPPTGFKEEREVSPKGTRSGASDTIPSASPSNAPRPVSPAAIDTTGNNNHVNNSPGYSPPGRGSGETHGNTSTSAPAAPKPQGSPNDARDNPLSTTQEPYSGGSNGSNNDPASDTPTKPEVISGHDPRKDLAASNDALRVLPATAPTPQPLGTDPWDGPPKPKSGPNNANPTPPPSAPVVDNPGVKKDVRASLFESPSLDPAENKPPHPDVFEPPQKLKKIWTGLPDTKQASDPNAASNPNKPQVQLRTAEEYYRYLNDFINKNLGPFEFDEATKRDLATRALKVAEEIKDDYGLTDEQVGKLARLSLFDIFILCDNSGSMRFGDRIQTLNRTLQGVAHWATRIEKDGISLRFLNRVNDEDGRFDNLTDLKKIDNLICSIPTKGNTKLGTVLCGKVVEPLVRRAEKRAQQVRDGHSDRESVKPRIVFIITDGKPQGEGRSCLRNEILAAKTGKLGMNYGSAATIFIISRVGHDDDAIEFIESLSEDDEISDLILSASDRLEDVIGALIGEETSEKNRNTYEKYLLNMFLDAVDGQSS